METPVFENADKGEIPNSTTVYDVNGEKVGEVSLSAMRDGYFVVKQGWLFSHELFLPATAIAKRDAMWVGLNLSKEELKDERWKQPPSAPVVGTSAQPFIQPGTPTVGPGPTEGGVIHLPPPEDETPLAQR